jgi:hypothetical protein
VALYNLAEITGYYLICDNSGYALNDCYGLIEERSKTLQKHDRLVEKIITNYENSLHALSDKYMYSFLVMRRIWNMLSEKIQIIS